jgi:hypothetical protein
MDCKHHTKASTWCFWYVEIQQLLPRERSSSDEGFNGLSYSFQSMQEQNNNLQII